MTTKDMLALALVGIGQLRVEPDGSIWRGNRRADTGRARGYLRLQFTVAGKRYSLGAHRVVWMVSKKRFIPHRMEINHKDGNKSRNCPDNLELVTHTGNTIHSFRKLARKLKEQRGEKNTSAKLTELQVLEIRSLWDAREMTQKEVGERYGISQRSVSEICLRKTWKHVP